MQKKIRKAKITFPCLLAAVAMPVVTAPGLNAKTFAYEVTLNVSGLAFTPGEIADEYGLDVILNPGSTEASNSVTFSDFSFVNGTAFGKALTSGGVTGGDMTGSFTLGDGITPSSSSGNGTGTLAEFSQQFTNSTTSLSFLVTSTQNLQATTPDGLSITLFDNGSAQNYISTANSQNAATQPNTTDGFSLVFQNITDANALGGYNLQTYVSNAYGVTATLSIPHPAGETLTGIGTSSNWSNVTNWTGSHTTPQAGEHAHLR